jgi:hypothetical protein
MVKATRVAAPQSPEPSLNKSAVPVALGLDLAELPVRVESMESATTH